MFKPDISSRKYWVGLACICLLFVLLGLATNTPVNADWGAGTKLVYNILYGATPGLFAGGLAYLLHRNGRRMGAGFSRPVAGAWWWTFWVSTFSLAAHLRSLYVWGQH